MKPELLCPTCGSTDIKKNGTTRRGKQPHRCRDCGRQFGQNPRWQPQFSDTKAIIDRLVVEKIPLAGIAPALQVSEAWLQQYVNAADTAVPQQVAGTPKAPQRFNVQMDEVWAVVADKGNRHCRNSKALESFTAQHF